MLCKEEFGELEFSPLVLGSFWLLLELESEPVALFMLPSFPVEALLGVELSEPLLRSLFPEPVEGKGLVQAVSKITMQKPIGKRSLFICLVLGIV